jgi:type II secretory pathway component GspD/PulD (secretin)
MDKEPVQFQIEVKLVETLLGGEKQVGFNWPKRISTTATGAEVTAPVSKSTSSQQEQRYYSAWYEVPQMGDDITWGVLTVDELKASL